MSTKNETPRTPAISAEIIGSVVTFRAATGEVTSIDAEALSAEIRHAAMMHGLKQKLGDAAAISRNPDTGRSASPSDKIAAIEAVREQLLGGNWNKTREAGDGAGAGGLLFKALCKVKADKTPVEIRAFLDGLDKAQQAALRKVPAVAQAIAELQAASAKASGVDGEDLLAML
jgi:hypothetical protein